MFRQSSSLLTIVVTSLIIVINIGCFAMPSMASVHHHHKGIEQQKPSPCCAADPLTRDHALHHEIISGGTLVPQANWQIAFVLVVSAMISSAVVILSSIHINDRDHLSLNLDPPQFLPLQC